MTKKLIKKSKEYLVNVDFEGDEYEIRVEEEWDEDGEKEVSVRFSYPGYTWEDECRFIDYVEKNWNKFKEIK
jgi:hypothetical protein